MSKQYRGGESSESVSKAFYESGITDGLPVVPPTEERVEEMLRGTDRPRDEVLGRLGNGETPITVEQLASNAVMAGCLPSYMPVLEAGIRALADPESNSIQFSVSTGSWAYQWIVNGPVREALNVESGSGAFGPNYHANQTIPRALGLAYKNAAGLVPGEKDMGVMGNPFKFSTLAGENQEANPWEPYHVTHGFDAEDSALTLAGPNSFIQWVPSENDAEHVLRGMIRNTPPSMIGGAQQGGDFDQTICYALCPSHAKEVAAAGFTKREAEEYVASNSRILSDNHQRGVLWEGALDHHHGKIDSRQVPQIDGPEYAEIVVVGGTGGVNAVIGPSIGGPVTEKITFPDGWESLVEEYALDRA